jgi:hypothetical protein
VLPTYRLDISNPTEEDFYDCQIAAVQKQLYNSYFEFLYDNERNRYHCKCGCHGRLILLKTHSLGKIRPCNTRADEMLAETLQQTSDLQQVSYIQIVY